MNNICLALILLFTIFNKSYVKNEVVRSSDYLKEMKIELKKEWPKNRTINLVFHGHSVPAGYFKTPIVNTLGCLSFSTPERA